MAYTPGPNDITPQMTSNIAPEPNVVSASSSLYYQPFQAFDHVQNAYCWIAANYTNQWLRFYFGGPAHVVTSYKVCGYYNDPSGFWITHWTFEGSHNGTDWDILDTRTGESPDSTGKVYKFSNSVAYEYYRICPTAGTYDSPLIGELELYEAEVSLTSFVAWIN